MSAFPMLFSTPTFDAAFERWVEQMRKFIDELPDLRCEAPIAAAMNGVHIPPCQELATWGDIETEFSFCPEHQKQFERGEFAGWR